MECFRLILRIIIIFFFLLDRKILGKVLEYSDEYKVDCVKVNVDNMLICKVYSRGERMALPLAIQDLIMCDKYGLKETKRMCCKFIINHDSNESYDKTAFGELIAETKFAILVGLSRKHQTKNTQINVKSIFKYAKVY